MSWDVLHAILTIELKFLHFNKKIEISSREQMTVNTLTDKNIYAHKYLVQMYQYLHSD